MVGGQGPARVRRMLAFVLGNLGRQPAQELATLGVMLVQAVAARVESQGRRGAARQVLEAAAQMLLEAREPTPEQLAEQQAEEAAAAYRAGVDALYQLVFWAELELRARQGFATWNRDSSLEDTRMDVLMFELDPREGSCRLAIRFPEPRP